VQGFFGMATGPCQAGFAGTHYYIYLEGGTRGRVPSMPVPDPTLLLEISLNLVLIRNQTGDFE
jgi:hypothetical protein